VAETSAKPLFSGSNPLVASTLPHELDAHGIEGGNVALARENKVAVRRQASLRALTAWDYDAASFLRQLGLGS
jgi:hypothetical protein